ncbi:MAG: toxic anion resistance protein [Fibrobacteria bacterium]|nr:toxic anion resistance protein [Fibrobacteria bacterium]
MSPQPSQKQMQTLSALEAMGVSLEAPPAMNDVIVATEEKIAAEKNLVKMENNIESLDKEIDPGIKALANNAKPEVAKKAENFVDLLLSNEYGQGDKRVAVDEMGLEVQQLAARRSSMLKEPTKTLYRSKDGKSIGDGLVDLKQKMLELDPVKFGLSVHNIQTMLGKTKIGKLIDKYWTKAQSMDTVINTIVISLDKGAQQLQRDNDTFADDQAAMREATVKLRDMIQVITLVDKTIESRLENGVVDPEQSKFVKQELLFPIRQRIMSLQQTLMACQQAIMTAEIMISTNRELLRATNDAKFISVVQLQNVLSLITGLYHQKDQLTKIKQLNETTSKFMQYGAELLDSQATEVQKEAVNCMIGLEVIEGCMKHINSAFQKIDAFREEALPGMKESVERMDKMISINEEQIKKRDKGKAARANLKLTL